MDPYTCARGETISSNIRVSVRKSQTSEYSKFCTRSFFLFIYFLVLAFYFSKTSVVLLIDWCACIIRAFESVFYDLDDAITTASKVILF